jgi:hypothetical protein
MGLTEEMDAYMRDLRRAAELNQRPGPRARLRQRQADGKATAERIRRLEVEDRLMDRKSAQEDS